MKSETKTQNTDAVPVGTNGAELHADTINVQEKFIEHNGKTWEFHFVEIPWPEKTKIMQMSRKTTVNRRSNQEVTAVDYEKLLNLMYLKTVRKAPEGFVLEKASEKFLEKLVAVMPGMDVVDEDDTENEDEDLKN